MVSTCPSSGGRRRCEWIVVRQDVEMPGLQRVTEVPHGQIYCQQLPDVGAVFLFCWAQLPGEDGEGLSDALHPLSKMAPMAVVDQGEWSGLIWMSQEGSSRQAHFNTC